MSGQIDTNRKPKIRVLVVDDSVVIRKILSDVLTEDQDIEVAGTAANGKLALQKITQVNPSVITLDIEMPEMNGLETVSKIRELHPKIPIIMFSTLTQRGASDTLEALSRGANEYVTKPAHVGSVTEAKEQVRAQLIHKIKALGHRRVKNPSDFNDNPQSDVKQPITPLGAESSHRSDKARPEAEIVAIGISTGGPNALSTLFDAFPATFPVPIVVTQHMPPLFTRMLAERIDKKGILRAVEAENGMQLEAGTIYIAPGGYHLVFDKTPSGVKCRLNDDPPENSCRPAVDVMFRSATDIFGRKVLAVVMTGMGYDGMLGCEYVRAAGGQVIAQDEATSIVWGMPGAVCERGLADAVLPLEQLPSGIFRRIAATQTSTFMKAER